MKITNKNILFFLLITIGIQDINAQKMSLDECITKAFENNKKLKVDANNISISKEKINEVKSNLYPKLSATMEYKYFFDLPTQLMPVKAFNPMAPEWQFNAAQFGVPHNINANIKIGMPVYNPKLYGGIKSTKIAVKLNKLKYHKSKEEIYNTIANLYYGAQIVINQINFIDQNILNSNKLLSNLKLLKEHQLVTGTDVAKLNLQVKQLQTQKQLLKSKYNQLINFLKINMGVNTSFDVDDSIIKPSLSNYDQNAITDIKLAQTKQKLTDNEIKTLKREKLPSILLYGSYGQQGYGYDKKPNDFLDFYSISFVGVKFDIPILDLSRKHKIKQKQLENESIKLQIELLTEQNKIEIENTQQKLNIALQNITNTIEQINIAQSIYNKTLLQHKQDTTSLTDVLLADNNLRQAQQNYISAVIDYLKADLELKKLTGNLIK
jgi:OMF family outer membrane factor